MDDCNCCDEINWKHLKEGLTATAPWRNKHPTVNKEWFQRSSRLNMVTGKYKKLF